MLFIDRWRAKVPDYIRVMWFFISIIASVGAIISLIIQIRVPDSLQYQAHGIIAVLVISLLLSLILSTRLSIRLDNDRKAYSRDAVKFRKMIRTLQKRNQDEKRKRRVVELKYSKELKELQTEVFIRFNDLNKIFMDLKPDVVKLYSKIMKSQYSNDVVHLRDKLVMGFLEKTLELTQFLVESKCAISIYTIEGIKKERQEYSGKVVLFESDKESKKRYNSSSQRSLRKSFQTSEDSLFHELLNSKKFYKYCTDTRTDKNYLSKRENSDIHYSSMLIYSLVDDPHSERPIGFLSIDSKDKIFVREHAKELAIMADWAYIILGLLIDFRQGRRKWQVQKQKQ